VKKGLSILLWLVGLLSFTSFVLAGSKDCASHCVYLPLTTTAPIVQVGAYGTTVTRGDHALIVVGEVVNLTSTPVYSVTVEARFYNNEELITTETTTTAFTATLPGQSNPFQVRGPSVEDYRHLTFELSIKDWAETSDIIYQPLTILSKAVSGGFQPYVSGTLLNTHSSTLTSVQVAVWGIDSRYDPNDTEFYTYYALGVPTTSTLAPQQTTSYDASLIMIMGDRAPPLASMRVAAQGVVAP
jgi:hypothetical protein